MCLFHYFTHLARKGDGKVLQVLVNLLFWGGRVGIGYCQQSMRN